jgi:hypothetical protein
MCCYAREYEKDATVKRLCGQRQNKRFFLKKNPLNAIAREYKGRHNHKTVWTNAKVEAFVHNLYFAFVHTAF